MTTPALVRNLRLKFSYETHQLVYVATLNTTNIGIWKGDTITAQVLKSNENQLMLTICEPETSKLFTILLNKNDEVDSKIQENDVFVAMKTLKFRNFNIYSSSSLQVNCTADIGSESSGKRVRFSFISIWILVVAMFLMS